MRVALITIVFAVGASPTDAQSPADRDAVLATVQTFFDTMTARDVAGARNILVPQGRFHVMDVSKPNSEPRSFSNEEYFAQLQASKQTMRERIWNPEVRVHGPVATMWAPYDFWIDGKLSHCGVDAFDLIKTSEGWKIAGGTYTIESGCPPSPLGPLKQ
jgi:Putative lumazine-binding